MQYTYQDILFTAQNTFWTHRFRCLLVLLLLFVSRLPHWQNVSLWVLFSSGETTISHSGWGQVNREGGIGVMLFLVKNWTLSGVWAGALVNHPSWNGQMHWKSLQKNSLKLNAASHNNASWCTDTDSFLEYSASEGKPVLEGACPPEDNYLLGRGALCVYVYLVILCMHFIIHSMFYISKE